MLGKTVGAKWSASNQASAADQGLDKLAHFFFHTYFLEVRKYGTSQRWDSLPLLGRTLMTLIEEINEFNVHMLIQVG